MKLRAIDCRDDEIARIGTLKVATNPLAQKKERPKRDGIGRIHHTWATNALNTAALR